MILLFSMIVALFPWILFQGHFSHLFHFQAWEAELFDDPAKNKVDPITPERVFIDGFRKVYRIEKPSVHIDESPEVHPFMPDGSGIFDGDQEP